MAGIEFSGLAQSNLVDPEVVMVEEILNPPRGPVREVGMEMEGSCPLGCKHCYMYQGENAPLRTKPAPTSLAVIAATGARMARHADQYNLSRMSVVLHGGEPLKNRTAGKHLLEAVRILRRRTADYVDLDIRVQTNAVWLNPEYMEELAEPDIDVTVGVSLDGMPEDHNLSRPFINGKPSYDIVARNIAMLRDEFPDRFYRLLCTLGPHNMHPPSKVDREQYGCQTRAIPTYKSMEQFFPDPKDNDLFHANFLWPHNNHDNPVVNWNPGTDPAPDWDPYGNGMPHADWSLELFDFLNDHQRNHLSRILLFRGALQAAAYMRGDTKHPPQGETFGLGDTSYFFIETNGNIRGSDALKVTPGADELKIGMVEPNVFRNDFSELTGQPIIALRQMGMAALSKTCLDCEFVRACGGGRFGDRKKGDTYQNPSVYCDELKVVLRRVIEAYDEIRAAVRRT